VKTPHRKRNSFGQVIVPSVAYASFLQAQFSGQVPKHFDWRSYNEAWKRRKRLRKISKTARKFNYNKACGKGK